jgi:pentatricopeptide repeat protein
MHQPYTYSSFINGLSKPGQMEQAEGVFDSMIASGITLDNHLYDSLIKGFGSKDETEEVIKLLRQMADMGDVLGLEITNSILTFLCNSSEHLDVMKLLPNFSPERSGGTSISCDELLMKIQKSNPELQLSAA